MEKFTMERSGHFIIHIEQPGEGSVFRPEVRGEDASKSGYNVSLGWIEGAPCITDLGSVGQVLVNSMPIEPHLPIIIQAGDMISIGNTHLTWTVTGKLVQKPVPAPAGAELASQPTPAEPAPSYSLIVTTAEGTTAFPLEGRIVRIGRAPDNDICIDHDRVSRYHAQVTQHAEGYEIVDLGSINGLTFQNQRVSSKVLADGDVIWLARGISLTCTVTRPATRRDIPPQRGVDETLVVPRQSARGVTAEGPDESAAVPRQAADETVVVPKPTTAPPGTRAADQTVVVPKRAAGPAEAASADQTVVVPKRAAGTVEEGSADQTVVVPKRAAGPAEDESADQTVVVPKKGPQVAASETPAEPTVGPAKAADAAAAHAVEDTAWVDMAQFLESVTDVVATTGTIVRNTQIPHLVIHSPKRTWEAQFTKERTTIGRGEENDISIPDPSISRHHAAVERRGDAYVIREVQSKNGIWLGKQRVEEHTLEDGDILSLGRAKLIYKGGFTSDDLTLIGTPRIDGTPARRPVVFVPGFGGSELWLGSERLWPTPRYLISNPEIYSLPGDPRIEARKIVSDVIIVPNIIKQEQYSRLGDYLETGLGYSRGKDLFEFAYDWRQDIRMASQRLAEAIERWQIKQPITIIAHSLGTLVTRYYVERLGGKGFVERIILMGGPHYGTPKGLAIILVGPDILPFGMGAERMRNVVATLPSSFQILPIYPCITDQNGNQVDVLKDESWLPERQRPFLRAARSFRRELGFRSSVPSVSIFGYGLKTILRIKVHRGSDGRWDKVDFVEDTAGDLSVPSGSAVLKNSEIHPVFQEHGSLYVDDDVRMRLKVELTRSTTWQRRMGR